MTEIKRVNETYVTIMSGCKAPQTLWLDIYRNKAYFKAQL